MAPAILAGAVVASWAFLAVAHAHDRFQLTHVGGARMALAQYAAHHVAIYPPIADGGFFGGTRFMPIPVALHAALSRLTGEYLASGKLLSYAAMAALLVLTFVALRRVRCPRGVAAGLAALILLTQAGFEVGTGIYADALPVALQLGAVLMVMSDCRRRLGWAGTLCAVALFTKQSALWGPAAIGLWLFLRDRRGAVRFTVAFVGSLALLFGVALAVTQGRILSVLALTFSGELGNGVSRSLTALGWFPVGAVPWALLTPFVVLALVRAVRHRRASLFQLCLVAAFGILAVVLSDVGTSWNHSLDVVVLASLVTGELLGTMPRDSTSGSWVRGAGVVTITVAMVLSSALMMASPVSAAVRQLIRGTTPPAIALPPLNGYIRPGDRVLSQDPSIPVLYGHRPVIEDPFMLLRVGREHPHWLRPLIASIRARRFDEVVLMEGIHSAPPWYFSEWEMGSPVIGAIRDSYRFEARGDGYFVYVPRV
jgi:hypothetical protein